MNNTTPPVGAQSKTRQDGRSNQSSPPPTLTPLRERGTQEANSGPRSTRSTTSNELVETPDSYTWFARLSLSPPPKAVITIAKTMLKDLMK